MKLISCNIYGFGALTDYNIVFDSQLHSIVGPNGFGKSTLFDFIHAMLYGMPTARNNETSLSMRKHYSPFGGKSYGGVLTMDTREGVISLERVFHESSASKDTLKVTDSFGKDLTAKYKNVKSIGEHFLGLDEDAYERTVAFREIGVNEGVGANQTISGKLNSIATSLDVGQYDRAMEALNDMIKSLSGKGTKNVSTISRLGQEIQKLSKEIKELETIRDSLTGCHQSLNGFKKEHALLQSEVERARNLNNDLALWNTYQEKLLKAEELKKELQDIKEQYPGGIPCSDTTMEIRDLGRRLKTVEIALENLAFSESDATQLTLLKQRYPNGALPAKVLDELEKAISERDNTLSVLDNTQFLKTQRLDELRGMFRHWQNPSSTTLEKMEQKSQDLDRKFENLVMERQIQPPVSPIKLDSASMPTLQEMQKIESLANQYKNNELQIQALAAQPTQTQPKFNKPIAIIGAIFIAIGVVLQVTGLLNYGVAVMFFGLAVVMFSFILKGSSNVSNQNNPALQLSQNNVVLEHQLKTFFARYQRYGTDFLAYYEELKEAIRQFKHYLQQRQMQQQYLQKERASLTAGHREMVDFITNVIGLDLTNGTPWEASDNYTENLSHSGTDWTRSGALNRDGDNFEISPDHSFAIDRVGNPMGNDNRNWNENGKVSANGSGNGAQFRIGFDIDDEGNENVTNSRNPNAGLRYQSATPLLRTLVTDYNQLLTLQKEYDQVESKRKNFADKVEQCNQKITDILSQYNIPSEEISVSTLRKESLQLENLTRGYNQYQLRKQELIKTREEIKRKIYSVYGSLSLEVPRDLTEASLKYEQDLKRSGELSDKINASLQQAEEYRQSINLSQEPKVTLTEDEIKEKESKIKELSNSITRLSDQIAQAEQDTSALPSMKEEQLLKTEELQKAQRELEVVKKTQHFIIAANKNLLDRYVRPIMDRYQDQIKMILPWLGSVTMDHNYKVSFKKDTDVARNCEHLSSGERTCLELALRLALIENMFHGDYPVLMMDDPFSELDPRNLEKALEILKGISTKMQVVYFSCSPERTIS